jgi:hypothetical protein
MELNEHLRRHYRELQVKMEALSDESHDSSSGDSLEARTQELRVLNNNIETLTENAQGMACYF